MAQEQHFEAILEQCAELIKESENGFMAGSRLSMKIRSDHPDWFKGRATKQDKGWLKVLAADHPECLVQVEVEGWKEPCYCVAGNVVKNAVAPPAKKARLAAESAPYEEMSVAEVLEKVGEETCAAIAEEVISVLTTTCGKNEALEGSRVGKMLGDKGLEVVEAAKEALGVRGWLRKIIDTCDQVERIKCGETKEHCYILSSNKDSSGTPPTLVHNPDAPAPKKRKAGDDGDDDEDGPARKRPGRMGMSTEDAEKKIEEKELKEEIKQLCEASVAVLNEDSRECGYIEGSHLSQELMKVLPAETDKVRDVLGKGWVRNVLQFESAIEGVEVDGVGEPCFRLVGAEITVRPKEPRDDKKPRERRDRPGKGGKKGKKGSGKAASKGKGGKDGGKGGSKGNGKSWQDVEAMAQMVMAAMWGGSQGGMGKGMGMGYGGGKGYGKGW